VKYRVRLTAKAEADVESVLRWFHEHPATVAGARWFCRLVAKIDTLETQPQRCAVTAESEDLGLEIRELLFGKRHGVYRILFRIEERTVHILRVWHGARDRVSPDDL
jgi:plasmid stabilization system protein ParE